MNETREQVTRENGVETWVVLLDVDGNIVRRYLESTTWAPGTPEANQQVNEANLEKQRVKMRALAEDTSSSAAARETARAFLLLYRVVRGDHSATD